MTAGPAYYVIVLPVDCVWRS